MEVLMRGGSRFSLGCSTHSLRVRGVLVLTFKNKGDVQNWKQV